MCTPLRFGPAFSTSTSRMAAARVLFSLRGHAHPIACLLHFTGDKTTLVSADNDGWLIWWDVIGTKRPIGIWKGHGSTILTMKQIDESRLMTHSKDSTIRIWDLGAFQDPNGTLLDLGNPQKFPRPPFFEIPVNTLNFCNVDYRNNRIITPSTMDSNNFDMYSVFDHNGGFCLKRLVANVDPLQLYNKSQGIDFEIPAEESGRAGFGIMMKVRFSADNIFYIGYESGDLLGFKVDYGTSVVHEKKHSKTVINKDPEISVFYKDSSHAPNPVLSLECSPIANQVVSGSTGKKLIIHSPTEESNTYNMRHYGIHLICFLNDLIAVGFWDGVVKGYQKDMTELFKFSRDHERISKFDILEPANTDSQLKEIKLNTVISVAPRSPVSLAKTTTKYKGLVKQKKAFQGKNLLITGYNDGLINAYETQAY